MKTRNLVLTALFTAITVICSQIAIPLPFSPVPLTLSLLAVFLTGALLEKKQALFAQLVYILLGAFGVPVFAGFRGGVGSLVGPTGGYLVAYPVMAFLIALAIQKLKRNLFFASLFGMASALIICYLLGTTWLNFFTKMGWYEAVLAGVAPFILLDAAKIAIAASISIPLSKAIKKVQLAGPDKTEKATDGLR